MLRSLKNLERYKVSATDGDIGSVANFLMDDARWTVRYLVVETGGFFGGRQVLITPIAFREVDYSAERFRLSISMEKVKNSPNINLDLPVSQQHERDYYGYYGYPYYWGYGGLWGWAATPARWHRERTSRLPTVLASPLPTGTCGARRTSRDIISRARMARLATSKTS